MYGLVREMPLRRLLAREGPPLASSLVVAEVFYRFHSFTLECGAFLATWFAASWAWHRLVVPTKAVADR